ncbi:TPA: hypothetical protein ACW0I5_004491 [Escherichia coli]
MKMVTAGVAYPVPATVTAGGAFQTEQKSDVAQYHHEAVIWRAETAGTSASGSVGVFVENNLRSQCVLTVL